MFTEDSASMGAVCSAMAGSTSTGTNQENSRTGVGIILNNPDVKSIALMRVLNTFFLLLSILIKKRPEEEERQRQILAAAAAEEEEEEGAEEEQIFVINVDPGAGGAGDPGPAVPPPAPPLPPPIVPGPAIPPPAGPPGGGGEEYEGEAGDVFVEPAFRRDRLRYLAGNARRKRRMPQQEEPELALPESLLLLLENGEEQNDFVADWGRCCVAANLSGGKVTSKAKCYADLSITEDLVFHLLDSQHLCLVRSPTESLAKIELHVYC